MRTATHPKLRKDPDFIDFLENPSEVCHCLFACIQCLQYVCVCVYSFQRLRRRQLSVEQALCVL